MTSKGPPARQTPNRPVVPPRPAENGAREGDEMGEQKTEVVCLSSIFLHLQ